MAAEPQKVPVTPEALALSARYLARACGPDGRFVYRVNLDPEVKPKPRYNLLRHAGAMYALAMYDQWRRDGPCREALARAGRFLRERCIEPVDGGPDMVAVWSRPEMTGQPKKPVQAKLGGSGLGLVALLGLEAVEPGATPRELLHGLGRFLVYMQKEDGGFYSKFIPSRDGRYDKWTSLYYPGEAALGLTVLYEADPSPRWCDAAARALGFLARSREGQEGVPADHWALIATTRLVPVHDCADSILRHAVQVCESIMREQLPDGGFAEDGRVTPTATRLEGLLAALEFVPDEQQELRARITSSVHRGMGFLVKSQVREGEFAGGFPRAMARLPVGDPRHTRSFNRRATEVRIDYVQHALCAMIQYVRLF